MKKIFILSLLLSFAAKTFSQVDTARSNTSIKTDYLKKSKTQKTVAWVFLGAGTTLIGAGIITGLNGVEDVSFNDAATGGGLIIGGALMDLGSIPLFIAGAKNKKRAMSVSINSEFVPRLQHGKVARIPIPTADLVLKL